MVPELQTEIILCQSGNVNYLKATHVIMKKRSWRIDAGFGMYNMPMSRLEQVNLSE